MNETLLLALALIPALIVAIVFHEVAHGWTALALGDPTAKEQRRLSFNPLRHVDPIGTVVVPGVLMLTGMPAFGWAKPVPVVKERLRNPRFGMMAVAAAGPGTNLVLAVIGAVVLGFILRAGAVAESLPVFAAVSFIWINVFLALFNLLPIPPFDGSHIVEGLLPPTAARLYEKLRPIGILLLFLLLLVVPYLFPQLGIIQRVVLPPAMWTADMFMAVASWVAGGINLPGLY